MLWRAWPGRSIRELAGFLLGELDEVGHRFHRQVRIDQHQERRIRRQHDRREILRRIVGQALVERDVDRECRAGAEHDRVAVGRRLGDRVRPDHRAGAGPVLDHDRLAETLRQPRRQRARQHIEPAAGGVGNHQRDRPAGIVLGSGVDGRQRRDYEACERRPRAMVNPHNVLPGSVLILPGA